MNRERWLFGVIVILVALISQISSAHSRFTPGGNIPGRTLDSAVKTGPCGGYAKAANPKTFQAGSSVRVDWQETVHHPGRFEFYFSQADDAGFVLISTVQNDQSGTTDLPHNYNAMINLPSTNCTTCTLQMIQVMTENPSAPSYYYSCADLQLGAQSVTPSPTPVPIPAPGPSGPATCN